MVPTTISIEQFAQHHRLKLRRDECGDPIIQGKKIDMIKTWKKAPPSRFYGHHIYEHGGGTLGLVLMFMPPSGADRSGKSASWNYAKAKLLKAGFKLHQDGAAEAILLFDPDNKSQACLAIGAAKCRSRRKLSPEQKEAMRANLAAARTHISKNPNHPIAVPAMVRSG